MSKITAYTALASPASNDVLPIVDMDDTTMAPSGTTKNITVGNLFAHAGVTDWLNVVTQYGATGNGTTDDTTAIQNAINAAGAAGGVVYFPPGNYLVSSTLKWTAVTSPGTYQPDGLAPSLIGHFSRPGTSPDIGPLGVTKITASGTFPVGEFMIDYVASTTTANVGFAVEGLMLACNSRAAGVRGCNQIQATWRNVVINSTATPNPANNFGLIPASGAMSFVSNPSVNANNNIAEDCYVTYAGQDCFAFNEGNGSWVVAERCFAINATRYGFVLGDNTLASNCRENGSGSAGFSVYNATMTGCHSGDVVYDKGNALLIQGSNGRSARITGCRFYGTNTAGTNQGTAMIQVVGSVAIDVLIDACTFISGTNTSAWLFVNGGVSGQFTMQNNRFATTSLGGSALTAGEFILFGTPAYVIRNCPGLNPLGTLTVAVPASGAATAAQIVDCTFYVTAAAGGSVAVAISGGPSITIPASAVVPAFVPAGQTLTPTYGGGNAPTWVVEGN